MTPLMRHFKEVLSDEEAFKRAAPIAKEIVERAHSLSASSSGKTAVSKTANAGSIPAADAKFHMTPKQEFKAAIAVILNKRLFVIRNAETGVREYVNIGYKISSSGIVKGLIPLQLEKQVPIAAKLVLEVLPHGREVVSYERTLASLVLGSPLARKLGLKTELLHMSFKLNSLGRLRSKRHK